MARIIVTARPGALQQALTKAGKTIPDILAATEGQVSRATVYNVFAVIGYPINKDYAQLIADALGAPIGILFVHRDGAPLA